MNRDDFFMLIDQAFRVLRLCKTHSSSITCFKYVQVLYNLLLEVYTVDFVHAVLRTKVRWYEYAALTKEKVRPAGNRKFYSGFTELSCHDIFYCETRKQLCFHFTETLKTKPVSNCELVNQELREYFPK